MTNKEYTKLDLAITLAEHIVNELDTDELVNYAVDKMVENFMAEFTEEVLLAEVKTLGVM